MRALYLTAGVADVYRALSGDGSTISGAWEIAHDGATWQHDFDLIFTRAG